MNRLSFVVALLVLALPWNLFADEPEPIAPKPIAPKPAVSKPSAPIYTAMVKVVRVENGMRPATLCEPTLIFPAGREAEFEANGDLSIKISVKQGEDPLTHTIQVKIIGAPSSKNPTVACAKLLTADGKPGKIRVGSLLIAATVKRNK
jgi:hypothetical protein